MAARPLAVTRVAGRWAFGPLAGAPPLRDGPAPGAGPASDSTRSERRTPWAGLAAGFTAAARRWAGVTGPVGSSSPSAPRMPCCLRRPSGAWRLAKGSTTRGVEHAPRDLARDAGGERIEQAVEVLLGGVGLRPPDAHPVEPAERLEPVATGVGPLGRRAASGRRRRVARRSTPPTCRRRGPAGRAARSDAAGPRARGRSVGRRRASGSARDPAIGRRRRSRPGRSRAPPAARRGRRPADWSAPGCPRRPGRRRPARPSAGGRDRRAAGRSTPTPPEEWPAHQTSSRGRGGARRSVRRLARDPSASGSVVRCRGCGGSYRRGSGAPTGVVQRGVFGFAAPLGISADGGGSRRARRTTRRRRSSGRRRRTSLRDPGPGSASPAGGVRGPAAAAAGASSAAGRRGGRTRRRRRQSAAQPERRAPRRLDGRRPSGDPPSSHHGTPSAVHVQLSACGGRSFGPNVASDPPWVARRRLLGGRVGADGSTGAASVARRRRPDVVAGSARTGPRRVLAIPVAAAERVAQQLVGILDRQEAGRVGVRGVRVVSLGEAPMGGLDLGRRRLATDAEHAVGVGDALHRPRLRPARRWGPARRPGTARATTSPWASRAKGEAKLASELRSARSSRAPSWARASTTVGASARSRPSPSSILAAMPPPGDAALARQEADALERLGARLRDDPRRPQPS